MQGSVRSSGEGVPNCRERRVSWVSSLNSEVFSEGTGIRARTANLHVEWKMTREKKLTGETKYITKKKWWAEEG